MRKFFRASWDSFIENCKHPKSFCSKFKDSLREFYTNSTRNHSAFSLGDVLVAIAIIGALAVILIPIYRTVNPDKDLFTVQ